MQQLDSVLLASGGWMFSVMSSYLSMKHLLYLFWSSKRPKAVAVSAVCSHDSRLRRRLRKVSVNVTVTTVYACKNLQNKSLFWKITTDTPCAGGGHEEP